MKNLIKFYLPVLFLILIVIAFVVRRQQQENPSREANSESEQIITPMSVPSNYLNEMDNGGQVNEIQYASLDYTQEAPPEITKTAFIYLPNGYEAQDKQKCYNILYLMHGWRMVAGDFFNQSNLKNILDHMIDNGDIEPMIVVTPTFDAENKPQGFSRSEAEIRNFYLDFRNQLVPYIESEYNTFADGTSEIDLRNSRSHRAFAGFSGGSVTTWSQFLHNLDYIKYFGPMSGDSWELEVYGGRDRVAATVDLFENVVTEGNYTSDDYYIYAATGTRDFAEELIRPQVDEMWRRQPFTKENLVMAISEGASHDLNAVQEYIYNMLPNFFTDSQ